MLRKLSLEHSANEEPSSADAFHWISGKMDGNLVDLNMSNYYPSLKLT